MYSMNMLSVETLNIIPRKRAMIQFHILIEIQIPSKMIRESPEGVIYGGNIYQSGCVVAD